MARGGVLDRFLGVPGDRDHGDGDVREVSAAHMTIPEEIRAAAKELGARGGKKGGAARAAKMTPEERSRSASVAARAKMSSMTPAARSEVARKASQARWKKARGQ